jgi:hypothetical protein
MREMGSHRDTSKKKQKKQDVWLTLTLSRSIQQHQLVGGGYFTNSLVEVDISTERPRGTDWFYVVERTTEDVVISFSPSAKVRRWRFFLRLREKRGVWSGGSSGVFFNKISIEFLRRLCAYYVRLWFLLKISRYADTHRTVSSHSKELEGEPS